MRADAFVPLVVVALCAACAPSPVVASPVVVPPAAAAPAAPPGPAPKNGVARLRFDARRLSPTLTSDLAKRFVAGADALPDIAPRTLWHDADKTHFYTDQEAAALPGADRAALVRQKVDAELYYNTKYGSPLSYSRPLDILSGSGFAVGPGTKIFDFGYGYAGHLRLLAQLGADATGIDVDPLLRALYAEPGDQGVIRGPHGETGRLRLLGGHFPSEPAAVSAVGNGYDLVISKNVLKKGYVHPDRPAPKKQLIDLGVSDDVILATFFAALVPGGKMLVYNICPKPTPPDRPFVPWSDGRSPFPTGAWEKAGFRVLVFDRDDTDAVRAMGTTLGWADDPDEPWDLADLSVLYTLVERPR